MYKLIMKQINAAYRDARIQKPLKITSGIQKENENEHMRSWNSQRRLEKMGKKQ